MPGGATPPNSVLPDWDEIDDYVKADPRARARPPTWPPTDVAEGKQLFEANGCAGCHGTSQWTIAQVFYTPNEANNGAAGLLRTTQLHPAGRCFPAALNPPSAATGTGAACASTA